MNHVVEIGPFNHVAVSSDGARIASTWGPAVSGEWFISPSTGPSYRVAGKVAALAELHRLADIPQVVTL